MERSPDIPRLPAQLEASLVEMDRLQRDIARRAEALARAVSTAQVSRTVYSVGDAAEALGVSVSMLHKLLRQQRLGHLKVGSRTLITAAQLEQFQASAQAEVRAGAQVVG